MSETQRVRAPAREQPRPGRELLALGVAFVVLWAALYMAHFGVIVAAFGAMWGLAVPFVALGGAVAILSMMARSLTGGLRVGAGILAPFSAVAMLVAAIAHYGQVPMMWVPALGVDIVFPVIAAAATLVWSAFLGPWTLRVLGACAGVGMIAIAASVFTPQPSPMDDLTRTPTAEEAFARYSQSVANDLSTDAHGTTFAQVASNGSLIVTADGGVVKISRDSNPRTDDTDRYPCWYIASPNAGVEEPQAGDPELTIADYSDSCVQDKDGWRRVDGLGYAHRWDSGYVFVESTPQSQITGYGNDIVRAAGGTHPADAEDVAAVLAALRPLTDDEVRVAYDAAMPKEPEN